jgi:ribosomal protein S18 acetylase RimI-like enzyme
MNELIPVHNEYTSDLEMAGYSLYKGWNPDMVTDLINHSHEAHIREFTPDDIDRRFTDHQAAMQWRADSRPTMYPLYKDEELMGVIWYSTRRRDDLDADYTFAIRMYEAARGKKLAAGFMKAVQWDFDQEKGVCNIWLKVKKHNEAARNLYEKAGYHTVSEDEESVVMVLGTQDRQ